MDTMRKTEPAHRPRNPLVRRVAFCAALLGALSLSGFVVVLEADQSYLQSLFVTRAVKDMTFAVEPGPSPAMQFPATGAYDQRLGYVQLPSFIQRLTGRNFVIEHQARQSPVLREFMEQGGYAIYHEKLQAGLVLLDRSGEALKTARYSPSAYQNFDEIPELLVKTLRFIEDRDILDPERRYRNPAIEWRRFILAAAERVAGVFEGSLRTGGASTLATQIEKYRHSPDGRTEGVAEKMRQMATATARAYLDGPGTIPAQRDIVTTYFNSTPLGSRSGYGEVLGLGDGLLAWYGVDFAEANRLLSLGDPPPTETARRALIYKEALSLLIAQRRPSYYLNAGRADLERLTDSYLRGLGAAGVIDPALRDAALELPLRFAPAPPAAPATSFVERKAVDAVRTELMTSLGVPDLYSLDRMDLSADVSIDAAAQSQVAAVLERLKNPESIKALGLDGEQLLGSADPGNVAWSVVLYERGADRNFVRIHADSLDEPFDINSGAKLILGSTAKLRTLATYLDIVESLQRELSGLPAPALRQAADNDRPLAAMGGGLSRTRPPSARAAADARCGDAAPLFRQPGRSVLHRRRRARLPQFREIGGL